MSSHNDSTTTTTGIQTPPSWVGKVLIGIIVILALGVWIDSCREKAEAQAEADRKARAEYFANMPAPRPIDTAPSILSLSTPATVTADYPFSLETGGKAIRVKYPGERPFVYHGGCERLRQPQMSGPKVFTDPNDPNGHIPFRIYPVRMGEVPPCK